MDNSKPFLKSYKYRIYPNQTQMQQLTRMMSFAWRVWNDSLYIRKLHYEATGKTLHRYELAEYWAMDVAKRYPDEIGLLPYDTISWIMKRLDDAYKAFFKRRANGVGFPKNKKRRDYNVLAFRDRGRARLREAQDGSAKLYIPKIGDIRMVYHRPLPDDATIQWAIVKVDGRGKWWVSYQIKTTERQAVNPLMDCVGIDPGLHHLLALSDGTMVENPRWYREYQRERRVLGRKLDRQRRANNPHNYNPNGTAKEGASFWKYSSRMKETKRLIAKLEADIAARREYFWHGVTDQLTRQYRMIAVEDLSLEFMQQNRHLSMSTADASLGMFFRLLQEKADERGVQVAWVKPSMTSKACACCGYIHENLTLKVRWLDCPSCGVSVDRDVNAAQNILKRAQRGEFHSKRGEW